MAIDNSGANVRFRTTDRALQAPELEYLDNGGNSVVTFEETSVYGRTLIEMLCDLRLLVPMRTACVNDGEVVTVAAITPNSLGVIRSSLEFRRR